MNPTQLTRQQVFDKVALHLLTQNRKSMDEPQGRVCRYRGAGGTMCAAGCLIPDDKYDPEMEGITVPSYEFEEGDPVAVALFAGGVSRSDFWVVRDLQEVHDFADVHQWPERLSLIAKCYNLSDSVVRNFKPAAS